MTLERCINLYDYGVFRIEEYLVNCSQNVEWRKDFVIGLQILVIGVLILGVFVGAAYMYRRLNRGN